jgi:hypothetical protein
MLSFWHALHILQSTYPPTYLYLTPACLVGFRLLDLDCDCCWHLTADKPLSTHVTPPASPLLHVGMVVCLQ